MEINWEQVKAETLWSYEDLIKKLQNVLAYNFVQEHYNHTMAQARHYAGSICHGYLQDQGDMLGYIHAIAAYLEQLERFHAGTYTELIHQVATRETCAAFLQQNDFAFSPLIQVLNYLLRWVLPFKTPLREYLDVDNPFELAHLQSLKQSKISSNLDLLETGRTAAGRQQLAKVTLIPLHDLTALVHRADISRLAYVRGKTVRHLCGGGYGTLELLAKAELNAMEAQMEAYYRTLGKRLADFKTVIPLAWMVGGAGVVPRVVED